MEQHNSREQQQLETRLDGLFAEYRAALPDLEASPEFMPKMWARIEARRNETPSWFRRLAQICVMATVALSALIGVLSTSQNQASELFYSGSYVEILAADRASDVSLALPGGDYR